jgi:alanine racemase
LRSGTQFAAVVKKNAYGHGLVPVAQHLASNGIDYLAVYSLEEGLELRRADISIPILVFGFIPPAEAKMVIGSNLTPTVMEPALASALDSAARELDTIIKVHVKVDTGLNRSGVTLEDAHQLLSLLFSLDNLQVEALYTHFSSANEPDKTPTETQLRLFLELASAYPQVKMLHAANSAATLKFPQTHLSLVRVGIAMYGLYPSPYMEKKVALKPVLSLKGGIVRIHPLRAGDGVGYGLTWTARSEALVALVPVGYGDGLPRLLSNRGEALVRGRRVAICGVISMDQSVLDVTSVPGVKVGDVATFIGKQPPEDISADEVAGWASTINYEVVTSIPSTLPRIFL